MSDDDAPVVSAENKRIVHSTVTLAQLTQFLSDIEDLSGSMVVPSRSPVILSISVIRTRVWKLNNPNQDTSEAYERE